MELTREQLEALAARVGERLAEHRAHLGGRYTLGLAGGERLSALAFDTPDAARTAAAALDMLRAEVDLPLPQVRLADAEGAAAGVPALLTSELAGEPLDAVLPRIPDEQLYALGRRLGAVAYRVHRVACARYGALAGPDPLAADDERGYGLARLEAGLAAAEAGGVLEADDARALRAWFDENFTPAGARAALVCGGLAPGAILVRQRGDAWSLSGLAYWDGAVGWSPAWEHTLLFDAAGGSRYFGLRVGYGNAYDDATPRAYEQVRESALRPYRALLALERLAACAAGGADAARHRAALLALVNLQG